MGNDHLMRKIIILLFASISINVVASPNVEVYKSWVAYMASDEMKGRKNGSDEIELVAHWIASQFKNAGLSNAPGIVNYFQSFQGRGINPYRNVIGFLEGSDAQKSHEYIIISAHYDHIGVSDGVVNNGADDNASGVSALLGIAHHLKEMKPERSVLFIAWSGEEEGLLGSKHYVANPVLPLKNAVLNLNLEMVGHTEGLGKKQFWITGAKHSSLYDELKQIGLESQWKVSPSPFPKMNLFVRSDNISLAILETDEQKKIIYGIPAHSISTWGREGHYHTPSDDIDGLDYDNLSQLVEVLSSMVVELAARSTVVEWREDSDVNFKHYSER